MSTFNMSWKELRTSIKNCTFIDCPRNKNKSPILFDRNEIFLSEIKFLVVSQEPGFSLRKNCDSSTEAMEKYLIDHCLQLKPIGTSPVNKMIEIFDNFDLSKDKIYWTHALKCVPAKSDNDIKNEWEKCASLCINHFRNELNLIPSEKLAIIAIGNYALALCRHILQSEILSHTSGIMEYIRTADLEKKFSLDEKEISLFPFIHPSHRQQILKQHDKNDNVKNKEKKFIERIRQFNQ